MSKNDLGRAHGVWIPVGEVLEHLANGWTIADVETAFRNGDVLMRPAERQERQAA